MTKSRGILPPRQFWTDEQIQRLKDLYPDHRTADIAPQICRSERSIYSMAKILGIKKSEAFLRSGMAGRLDGVRGGATRFQKGHQTWNKGQHFDPGGRCAETRFKKGVAPHNTKPVGSYRLDKDGTLQQKVGTAKGNNSKRWRGVHELVWIEANGPIPEKHIVVFKKGMKTSVLDEITVGKVECISLAENMRRNSYHNYGPEIAGLIQLRGAITRQINQKKEVNHGHQ